jgi:hypothetical protein
MSDPNFLFELLQNADYIRNNTVNMEKIQAASITDIIDLGAESAQLTSAAQVPHEKRAFAHSASLSLGGGRQPCSEISCRSKRAEELSQFAALYSDKVYIHNFLSDLARHPEAAHEVAISRMRIVLAEHLEILLKLRPLIEANLIVPLTAPKVWCTHCFRARVNAITDFDPGMMAGLASAGEYLLKRFLSETKVTIKKQGKNYVYEIRAPEDLLEHGFKAKVFAEMPKALENLPEVRALLARGRAAPLSSRQMEKIAVHKTETSNILTNVLFELTVSQSFGTSFLTERPIHVKILQAVASDDQQQRRNDLIKRYLTTLVPFLEGLTPKQLLTFESKKLTRSCYSVKPLIMQLMKPAPQVRNSQSVTRVSSTAMY